MGVAAELQLKDKPALAWENDMKTVSNQDTILANATQKMIAKKISTIKSKPTNAPKKLCVCAPTTHVGSFKCRLHRIIPTRKSSSPGDSTIDSRIHESFQSAGQTQLSRFGRAAAAAASVQYQQSVR